MAGWHTLAVTPRPIRLSGPCPGGQRRTAGGAAPGARAGAHAGAGTAGRGRKGRRGMAEQWLTYQQAGDLLGVSSEAIRRHATRYGWRRQPGNDGKTLVLMTDREAGQVRTRPGGRQLERPGEHLSGRPPERPGDAATVADTMAALVADRLAAEARRDAAQAEAEQQRERAARAEGERDGLREAVRRADEAVAMADRRAVEAAERLRESRERLEELQAMSREARKRVEELRLGQEAEVAALRGDVQAERERGNAALARAAEAEEEVTAMLTEAAARDGWSLAERLRWAFFPRPRRG